MSTNIKLKKSSIAGRIPSTSDLDYGELAINYADGKIFYKNSSNQIKSFIDSAAVQSLIDNVNTGGGGTDSASVISLILSTVDSDYIALREADVNGGLDSAAVLNLIPAGTYKGIIQSSYTATAGQASFSADYTVGQVLVYLNGLLLSPDDYIATNGSSVSLVVNADSGDEIRIVDIIAGGIDSSASLDLMESTIDSAYVAARGLKYTDFSVSVQAPSSPNLTFNNTNGVFSYTPPNLSAYVTTSSLPNYGYTTYDSADTLGLVDSDYVQSKFTTLSESDGTLIVSGSILPDLDSTYSIGSETKKFKDIYLSGGTVYIDDLGLSANTNGTITIGQLDSVGVLNSIGVIATVDSEQVGTIVDSAYLASRLTNYVTDTELAGFGYTTYDSTNTTGMLSGYATQSYVTTQINNLIGGAPSTLDTLNEIAAALNDDDSAYGTLVNLIGTKTDFDSADAIALITENDQQRDSAFVTNIVDSAYIDARTSAGTGTDSATVINLITETADSAYIAARAGTFGRVSIGENTFTADSGQTSFSVAYVPGAVQVFLNGILLSNGLDYIATNGSSVVLTSGADSGDAVVVNALGGDSARIQDVVDSAYINARVSAGTDSSTVEVIVEGYGYSTYDSTNAAGQIEAYGYLTSAIDSTGVIALITANAIDSGVALELLLDSIETINLIDSAYVQARQTTQDFAYSSLTGAPNVLDSADVVSLITANDQQRDSAFVTGIIDSDYIQARQSSVGSGGLDSAAVLNIFPDGTYRGLRTYEFTADSGQTTFTGADDRGNTLVYSNQNLILFLNGILLVDSADYTATDGSSIVLTTNADSGDTVTAFNIVAGGTDSALINQEIESIVDSAYVAARTSAGTDSATVVTIIESTADSAYVQARQTAQDFAYSSLTGAPNVLDSTNVSNIVTDFGYSTFDSTSASGMLSAYAPLASPSLTGTPTAPTASAATNTTQIATTAYVTTAIDNLIDGAPGTLNTLNEIAAALNDDDSAYNTLVGLISGKTDFDSTDAIGLITGYGYSTYDSTNTIGLVDSSYVQARQTAQDFAYSSLTGAPTVLDSANVSSLIDSGLTTLNASNITSGTVDSARLPSNVFEGVDSVAWNITSRSLSVYKVNGDSHTVSIDEFGGGTATGTHHLGTTAAAFGGTQGNFFSSKGSLYYDTFFNNFNINFPGYDVNIAADAVTIQGDLKPSNNNSRKLGDSNLRWSEIHGGLFTGDSGDFTYLTLNSETIDSAWVQARQDFAYSSLTGTPTVLDSANVISVITGSDLDMGGNKVLFGNVYDSVGALPSASTYHGMFAHVHATGAGYFAHAGNWVQLANNSDISTYGNSDVTSLVDSTYVQARQTAQDFAYSSLTGAPTVLDSANVISLITANDQQRDSGFVTGIIDSDYINARVDAVSGTDSAATIALIEATVDSAYVALREANTGGSGGGLDSAAVIALIDLNGGGNNNLVFTTYDYIATADQTTFSGNDKDGNGLTYNSGSVQVYRNGILLVETDDYTASNGGSVILNTGADSGDYISIATFEASISSIGISSYEFVADSGQTTFSGTATNGDVLGYTAGNLLVHLNGVLLTDSDDYTATSGTSIVLGVAADSADLLHITTFAASSRSQWGATNASITAVSNKKYIVDTSSAVTITLPSSPNFGDEVGVVDGTGNAGTNNITVSSSSKILASDSDLTLDINRSGVTLTYYNSTQGWIITSTV